MAATVPPVGQVGPQKGKFYLPRIVKQELDELTKVEVLMKEAGNNPNQSLNQIADRKLRDGLILAARSKFNIADGKKSELAGTAMEMLEAAKAAAKGKALDAKQVEAIKCQAEILKRIGDIQVAYASGKKSPEKAFYRAADTIVRSIARLAEKGGPPEKAAAAKQLKAIRKFQNIPSVNAALAKNATKLVPIESLQQNQQALQFMDPQAFAGDSASGGENMLGQEPRGYNPAEAAQQLQQAV